MSVKRATLGGWGNYPVSTADLHRPERLTELTRLAGTLPSLLARGGGRSYGDQALNGGGALILTGRLDRMLEFDEENGVLICEPGVTFGRLIEVFLPRGWLVPVTPGTGFATLGGAIANDVHGKNHDREGAFGAHVLWFDLLLADGQTVTCSPEHHPDLFDATLGGGGLTGIITCLAVQLKRVPSNAVLMHSRRMGDLDDFIEALEMARLESAYSVGWIDATVRGRRMGRGILETGAPSPYGVLPGAARRPAKRPPMIGGLLNRLTVSAFNALYWRRITADPAGESAELGWDRFLYPLDAIIDWNRMYGKGGFHQFQCVLPDESARAGLVRLLEMISTSGAASFLAVLKTLGAGGRGLLSFPRRGFTLALDFPHRPGSLDLLARLERITLDHGGRIYLAKDSVLAASSLAAMYPRLEEFKRIRAEYDPGGRFVSDQARRLGLAPSRAGEQA